jgi:hypothetical protein
LGKSTWPCAGTETDKSKAGQLLFLVFSSSCDLPRRLIQFICSSFTKGRPRHLNVLWTFPLTSLWCEVDTVSIYQLVILCDCKTHHCEHAILNALRHLLTSSCRVSVLLLSAEYLLRTFLYLQEHTVIATRPAFCTCLFEQVRQIGQQFTTARYHRQDVLRPLIRRHARLLTRGHYGCSHTKPEDKGGE